MHIYRECKTCNTLLRRDVSDVRRDKQGAGSVGEKRVSKTSYFGASSTRNTHAASVFLGECIDSWKRRVIVWRTKFFNRWRSSRTSLRYHVNIPSTLQIHARHNSISRTKNFFNRSKNNLNISLLILRQYWRFHPRIYRVADEVFWSEIESNMTSIEFMNI